MRRFLFPVLAGLVLGALFAALLDRTLDGAVAERTRHELESRLLPLTTEFAGDLASGAAPHEKVRAVARQTGARVTLIAADGRVLADSEVEPERLPGVENHGTRPEVVEARSSGFGFYRRTSATVEVPFVYVARRVGTESAPVGYVRLAMSQHELDAQEAPFRRTIDEVSIGAGLLVALLFLAVRQRQRRELTRVIQGIGEAAQGRAPALPRGTTSETAEVFAALGRFARLVSAEREGSQKERLLARTVFEEVPAGLIVVDASLDLLDANPAALALFRAPAGVSRRALLDLVREPAVHRLFEAGVSPEGEASGPRTETVRLGGESAPEQILEVTVRPLPHANRHGEPAAVGVVRDVTEREQTEMMRRRFVSDVSHELRTPVAAIRAAVETLSSEGSLPSDLVRLLDILKRQSSQMQDLLSDLMDLSEIESGTASLQNVAVPLRPLLAGVVNDLSTLASARGVTVAVEAPDGLSVAGDPRRLSQVFRNLIDNAIKFSAAGTRVDVLAEAAAGEPGSPGRAVVHVVDRGVGIPRSELRKIFQRFYRVDPSRAKAIPGTGLGLAIVKHLLILHNGTIAVESEPGRGSRFSVTLPAAPAPTAATLEAT